MSARPGGGGRPREALNPVVVTIPLSPLVQAGVDAFFHRAPFAPTADYNAVVTCILLGVLLRPEPILEALQQVANYRADEDVAPQDYIATRLEALYGPR